MKVNAKICFYAFKNLQGWRYQAVRLLSFSRHTHAHLEFDTNPAVALVVTDCGKLKVIRPEILKSKRAIKYYEYSVGLLDFSGDDLMFANKYPSPNSFVMIFYMVIGRFFGMKKPASCITFICDYLKFKGLDVPTLFTPKELWEELHATNNDRWKSQSGEDYSSQMAK
jgi:hypothetical protein